MTIDNEMRRRHALVSGVAGGIAPHVAAALKAEGMRVTGIDIRGAIESTDVDLYRAVDIADADAVRTLVDENPLGVPIDVLVNCAAVPQEGTPLHELEPDEWTRSLAVNLSGAWALSRAVVPGMIAAGGGAIVNLASTSAMKPRPGAGAYSVAKAGVRAMSRAQAGELAQFEISVNTVIPGATRTMQYAKNWGFDDPDRAFASRPVGIPSGKLVEPEQIAEAVLFFVRQPGASVTGSELVLDGGYTI